MTATLNFASPNGAYSISVSNAGITLATVGGPSIELTGSSINELSPGTITVQAGGTLTLKGSRVDSNVAQACSFHTGGLARWTVLTYDRPAVCSYE